jgi:pSer/pThr/pTyr-binding forkhead associated (FHA) protein
MPWLTTEGASHQIAEGETIVGSGEQAGWRLPRQDLGARHFVIERRGPRISVRPCSVDNIIAVNGVQCGSQPRELKDGDTVDAGNAQFLFSSERSGSYPAVPVGPAHLLERRAGIAHDLTSGAIGIGRDRSNAVVVRDPTASRFHAEIRREAGGYVLRPRGSSGTLLNGKRIGAPERLRDGDQIEIANVEFRFLSSPMPLDAPRAEPGVDDDVSTRPTVEQTGVMAIPSALEQRARSLKWIWIAALLVAAATVWLASR